ncbi:branched-chain amino acid ABC transporter permease [Bosea sp. (in: a-proteobacteria)]|jgi:branched-chain amino acid transport system permease protein|uniref:branched-chain amino acid ABC transporter permease n=1 Tax=Bosea sp. (in: a-proteobacteria) TaxID=1871050 RepID=UPI002DDD99A0|nr:branched-chain amino acid ABC transporter permease [Bosea sp. (in: a-proteobacteria)]HEV2508344.1 branched-chain amino acid ABC transporter permease [Bosea sp. (in: a-proteobacteria)]
MTASIIQAVLLSLSIAGLYAAVAAGLTLTVGVTRIINFAHGEFVMLGAFLTYGLYTRFGVSPWLGMLASGVALGAFSILVYRLFLARVLKQDEHNQLLATLGLSILLLNIAIILWSPDPRVMQAPALLPSLQVAGVTVPGNNIVVALVGILLFLVLLGIKNYTRYGTQMRFASDDPVLAMHAGINVDRIFELSFVIGGAAAGLSGGLVALVLYVQPTVGVDLVIRAFAIIALGGLGNIPGALFGAAILALVEGLIGTFVPGGGSWGFGVAFLILLLVLLVRPSGLFGRQVQA